MNELQYKSTYKTMAESTVEDAKHIICGFNKYLDPDYLTQLYSKLLIQLKDCEEGFPINRYEHSLQTATLAHRDGRDNEYVICALLHDVGEVFDPYSHDNIIAELLKNYITDKNYFILKHHTTFQGFYYWDKIGLNKNAREQYSDSIYYQDCIDFVAKYDNIAFDQNYNNMNINSFEQMMYEFFKNRNKHQGNFAS